MSTVGDGLNGEDACGASLRGRPAGELERLVDDLRQPGPECARSEDPRLPWIELAAS
jgi:hypothetical protein